MRLITKLSFAVLPLIFITNINYSQSSSNNFLSFPDSLNKTRLYTVTGTWAGIYSGALIGLSQLWYKDYPHSSFHFFNDNAEWKQVDKVGHFQTAYFESVWSTAAFKWTGMNEKTAYWVGGATGFVLQTSIEVLDGFSAKWGASVGDLAGNALGSSLCISQNLLWDEQRMQLKFSFHYVNYKDISGYDEQIRDRVNDLYGTSFFEHMLKDYNGQTYWLSVNPSSFMNEETKFPKWLSLSIGYGAEGMLGGFDNSWYEDDELIVRDDVQRNRQFYLSPDIDFTRLKTNSDFLKLIFGMANTIKFPAPAFEISGNGKMKFHAIYF